MSLVLTNSYKSIIIAYLLSVPWVPEQDYDYFEQLQDFKFYSPVSAFDENEYWQYCKGDLVRDDWVDTCQDRYYWCSFFGKYFMQIQAYLAYTPNILVNIFKGRALAFPKNESKEVFQKLINGEKMVVVGYSEEINKMLVQLKAEFKGTRFFRGKEQLWSHNKNWAFSKISYSQPHREFVQLMASGIYQFWKYWLRDRKSIEPKLKFDNTAQPDALALTSNVAFVFVILIIGLTASTSTFWIEISFYSFNYYDIRDSMKAKWRSLVAELGVRLRVTMQVLCRKRIAVSLTKTFLFPWPKIKISN